MRWHLNCIERYAAPQIHDWNEVAEVENGVSSLGHCCPYGKCGTNRDRSFHKAVSWASRSSSSLIRWPSETTLHRLTLKSERPNLRSSVLCVGFDRLFTLQSLLEIIVFTMKLESLNYIWNWNLDKYLLLEWEIYIEWERLNITKNDTQKA